MGGWLSEIAWGSEIGKAVKLLRSEISLAGKCPGYHRQSIIEGEVLHLLEVSGCGGGGFR